MPGANIKWVHEDIWDITANAFALDIGANYHTEFMDREIRIGLSINNLGSSMAFGGNRLFREIEKGALMDDDDPPREITTERQNRAKDYGELRSTNFNLPTSLNMGIMYIPLQREMDGLILSGDYSQPNNMDYKFAAGAEYYRSIGDGYQISARCGWEFKGDELDYEMQVVENGEYVTRTEEKSDGLGGTV